MALKQFDLLSISRDKSIFRPRPAAYKLLSDAGYAFIPDAKMQTNQKLLLRRNIAAQILQTFKTAGISVFNYSLPRQIEEPLYVASFAARQQDKGNPFGRAKLIKADQSAGVMEISIKEVNPNPFYGADRRHPIGSTRQAVVSGTYAGGVFCRMQDDTTCLCLYSPNYFSDELYIEDTVLIAITQYDYGKKLIYGKLLSRL